MWKPLFMDKGKMTPSKKSNGTSKRMTRGGSATTSSTGTSGGGGKSGEKNKENKCGGGGTRKKGGGSRKSTGLPLSQTVEQSKTGYATSESESTEEEDEEHNGQEEAETRKVMSEEIKKEVEASVSKIKEALAKEWQDTTLQRAELAKAMRQEKDDKGGYESLEDLIENKNGVTKEIEKYGYIFGFVYAKLCF